MNVLTPITLTDAMFTSSTVAEPAAGETSWVSAGTYVLGDRRIRTTTHKVYECVLGHTGRTALPEIDTSYWLEYGPTNKWAALDTAVSTQTTAATTLTMVLAPGFCNSFALYGMDASTLVYTYKETTGGTVSATATVDLLEPPLDWYDWGFGTFKPLTKYVVSGLTPFPSAELTITVSTVGTAKLGMVVVGDLQSLMGENAAFGGTEYGASAEPITYSYIKTDEYGTTSIKRRHAATDMRARVVLPHDAADYALSVVQGVLDVPAAWIATDSAATGYSGLNVFGLGSGSLSYDSFNHAVLNINVKGMI